MIGRLMGSVLESNPGQLLMDVGGVGYEVEISLNTYAAIAAHEGPLVLHTHLVVREDAQVLYGFSDIQERSLFRSLIRVNGVGPKMALAILSGLDAAGFAAAVHGNDVKTLTGLPGVGKKTAERLIIEMRDKLDAVEAADQPAGVGTGSGAAEDAEEALIGLGYRPQEAARALARIDSPAEDVETLIKQALKLLMQN